VYFQCRLTGTHYKQTVGSQVHNWAFGRSIILKLCFFIFEISAYTSHRLSEMLVSRSKLWRHLHLLCRSCPIYLFLIFPVTSPLIQVEVKDHSCFPPCMTITLSNTLKLVLPVNYHIIPLNLVLMVVSFWMLFFLFRITFFLSLFVSWNLRIVVSLFFSMNQYVASSLMILFLYAIAILLWSHMFIK
jgi:hypothetical protein